MTNFTELMINRYNYLAQSIVEQRVKDIVLMSDTKDMMVVALHRTFLLESNRTLGYVARMGNIEDDNYYEYAPTSNFVSSMLLTAEQDALDKLQGQLVERVESDRIKNTQDRRVYEYPRVIKEGLLWNKADPCKTCGENVGKYIGYCEPCLPE